MPGAPTGNENNIKLLLSYTHHLTVSCGTYEYFMSFTHILAMSQYKGGVGRTQTN